mgnify:CR=1 FL=1
MSSRIIVALSGGVGALIMQALTDLGIGQRLYASNGNACDVSISEIVRYYGYMRRYDELYRANLRCRTSLARRVL